MYSCAFGIPYILNKFRDTQENTTNSELSRPKASDND